MHGGTPYPQALGLTPSYVRAYLQSTTHTQHVKAEEARQKLDIASIGRLDMMLKAFGALARVIVAALSRPR